MPRNERLASALAETATSTLTLAAAVGVDPKTAERWVSQNRVPHPRYRVKVAEVLRCGTATLWPETESSDPGGMVTVYPSRRAVPPGLWRTLVTGAQDRFDLHAFAATFLPDQMDLAAEVRAMADRGVTVRLLLGDPDGDAVQIRSEEEGGTGLSGRIDLVLTYLAPALDHPGVEIRLHDHTLYASLFRFDDDLLVNLHVWGSPAASNPVLHLRTEHDADLVTSWQAGFDRVWDQAIPVTAWPRAAALREATG